MSFEMVAGQTRMATDPDRDSRMTIKSGPQIELKDMAFSIPGFSLEMPVLIRPKFPDKPVVTNNSSNPCIMLPSGNINAAFGHRSMHDFKANTRLAEYDSRMVAFINKHHSMSNAPFLWSDYRRISPVKWYYEMPTDEELLKISLQPEQ